MGVYVLGVRRDVSTRLPATTEYQPPILGRASHGVGTQSLVRPLGDPQG